MVSSQDTRAICETGPAQSILLVHNVHACRGNGDGRGLEGHSGYRGVAQGAWSGQVAGREWETKGRLENYYR